MNRPRIASSAYSGCFRWACRLAAAALASRSNTLRARSVSQRATSTVAAASRAVATSSGKPSVRRRASQSARGRPIKVSTIGAAISTPSVSPPHQVHQVKARAAAGTTPAADKASVDSVAFTVQASTPPSRQKAAMSRGSTSATGPRLRRRTSAAPSSACSAAPSAMASGSSPACRSLTSRSEPSGELTR